MKVVILCGGKGTRIADAQYDAKGLVEIGGKPILWHIIQGYAHFGFNEFVLTLGHGGDSIKRYFLDYEAMTHDFTVSLGSTTELTYHTNQSAPNLSITLADTGLDTNKGARVTRVLQYLDDGEPFHLTYGDGVSDIDIRELTRFHKSHGKLMTVTGYQPFNQYGILELDDDGLVTGFEEKPRLSNWINAGYMVCEPELMDYFKGKDDKLDLEKEVMVQLAVEQELVVYKHDGFWRSMDTFKEAMELDRLWKTKAPWKVW